MPTKQPENQAAIDWLAKSLGFVDKVCCYSYSEQQIFEESEDNNMFANPSQDWEADDSSIVADSKRQSSTHQSTAGNHQVYNLQYQHAKDRSIPHKTSPARSISTASTVTTSTTTTIVTSMRTSGDSLPSTSQRRRRCLDAAARRFHKDTFHSERSRSAPHEIYCPSSNSSVCGTMSESARSPSVPVTSATEGYQC